MCVLVWGVAARASQVVIQDVTYTHDATTTHDSHNTLAALAANPASWTSPVDYTAGTAVVRLEVLTKPSDAPTRFQICFEGNPYSCTNQAPTYTTTGVYTWSSRFDEFYSPGTPRYTVSPAKMSLILKDDKNGKPAPENVGATESARYMPTTVRVVVTLVSEGATYVAPSEPVPPVDDPPVDDPVVDPPSAPTPQQPPAAEPTPVAAEPTGSNADDNSLDLDHLDVNGGCAAAGDAAWLVVLACGALLLRHRRRCACVALALSLLALAACESSVTADGLDQDAYVIRAGDDGPTGGDSRPTTDTPDDAMPVTDDDGDAGPSDTPDIDPQPTDLIHYIGRFDFTYPDAPVFAWPATSIAASFNGTGVDATLDGADSWFEVFIDGAQHDTIHFTPQNNGASARTVTLATGLGMGTHDVQLYRRVETFFGASQFLGFTVKDGALIPSVFPYTRRLEFIGDSITCGYGNEGDGPVCSFTADTENGANTYAAQAARNLDAALSVVAWSGKGMLREYSGATTDQMPVLYDRAVASNANSTWDFDAYVPDAIVIDLGTNDWSGGGDPGEPYVAAYVTFVTRLRSLYPSAEIFCTMGPMQNSSAAHDHVKDVVQRRKNAGDNAIHYVGFASQDGAPDLGCDYHPGPSTHAAMAVTITEAVRDVMGW